MSILSKIGLVAAVGLIAALFFLPILRQAFTRVVTPSETITLPASGTDAAEAQAEVGRGFEIVTLLVFDSIPAILDPGFVGAVEADEWMDSYEPVLGVSLNGDHRAYPVRMLSRHEIVNDVVGELPVAVTW